MKLISNLNSSAIRFLTVRNDVTTHTPDVVEGIRERYRFWDYPKGPAEFNLESGSKFTHGRFQETTINTLQLFSNGIFVQTEANTALLDEMIEDLISWYQNAFGGVITPSEPVRKVFVSSVEVRVDQEIVDRFERLQGFATRLSHTISDYGMTIDPYRVTSIILQTDPALAKPVSPGRFLFERRAGASYAENVFFSEAPVSTEQHLELLAELERSL